MQLKNQLTMFPAYHWLMVFLPYVLFSFQSEVFAVAFALLAAGAVILTLNVLLLVLSLSLSLAHTYTHTHAYSLCSHWHGLIRISRS